MCKLFFQIPVKVTCDKKRLKLCSFFVEIYMLFTLTKITHIYTHKLYSVVCVCVCVCLLCLLCTPATHVSKYVTVTVPVISGKQEHLVS